MTASRLLLELMRSAYSLAHANNDGAQRRDQRRDGNASADQQGGGLEAEVDHVRARVDGDRTEQRVRDEHPGRLAVDGRAPTTVVKVGQDQDARTVSGRLDPHFIGPEIIDAGCGQLLRGSGGL